MQVLDAYGHTCKCCGETQEAFLALDHVNNDGKEHRSRVGKWAVYKEALEEVDSGKFQLLCHNCNFAKYTLGVCPHQLA